MPAANKPTAKLARIDRTIISHLSREAAIVSYATHAASSQIGVPSSVLRRAEGRNRAVAATLLLQDDDRIG